MTDHAKIIHAYIVSTGATIPEGMSEDNVVNMLILSHKRQRSEISDYRILLDNIRSNSVLYMFCKMFGVLD